MNLKRIVQNYFGFSRVETNGFLVLIPLMLVILFSEPLYRHWKTSQPLDHSRDVRDLDSLIAQWEVDKKPDEVPANNPRQLFAFNPNTATRDEFIELGFYPQLTTRIENYRNKGGRFLVKNDLLKIYGMDSLLFVTVRPHIQLPEEMINRSTAVKKEAVASNPILKKESVLFDINTADTSQLKSIYGIGEKLSLRIVKYRESLGGFVHMKQLSEVFGLDSTIVKRLAEKSFIVNDFKPVQLDLNTVTEEALDRHPYITKKEAKAIVAYRFQHQKFSSIDDLEKIVLIEKPLIQKMMPYFRID